MNEKCLNVKLALLPVFLLFAVFTFVPQAAHGQNYNVFTLEYFKKSLECLMTGDYDNAILNSTHVIRRDPQSSVAYTIRARAYFEKRDMNNTIADCTQAISLDRNNLSAFSLRGNAYARSGNMTRAINDWQAGLRINPENEELKKNIETARQQTASN